MTPKAHGNVLGAAIGSVLAAYVVYCIARGQISARVFGARQRPVLRSEQPIFFWFLISCQVAVAAIMVFAL